MILGNYFIKNEDVCSIEDFIDPFNIDSLNIYEVIRVDDGIPLFIEDHLVRLNNSLLIAGKELPLSNYNVIEKVRRLIKINKIKNGLIRIIFSFSEENRVVLTIFQNRATFPPIEYYTKGISCLFQYSERDNPSAKIFNSEIRGKANSIINSKNIYESILVNSEGNITEGSRSNLFFIKDSTIYTAPDSLVLQGITRLKVIDIISLFNIHLQLTPINIENLKEIDAMFITGTTPKVLPINRINDVKFNVNNTIITNLKQAYDNMIDEYKMTHH